MSSVILREEAQRIPADLAHFESFTIGGFGSQSTWRTVKSVEENPRQFLRIRVDRR